MTEAGVKGVIFDLDGTLYTLAGIKMRMAFALASSVGTLRHLTRSRAAVRTREFDDRQGLLEAFYGELASNAKISIDAARSWYQERFLSAFVKLLGRSARTRDGLADLLRRLKDAGVKLAVVSDFGVVKERIEALNLSADVFDDLVAAEDYGVLKPAPRPMTALADKWNVKPQDILVVGDRKDLDEDCAVAAGMQFLGIADKATPENAAYISWNDALKEIEARTNIGVNI